MKDSMSKLKKISIILPVFLFFSCASGDIYSELVKNFSVLFSNPEDISKEKIESIPYASMQARLGRSENILIILEEENEDLLKWTSSNLVKIYTRNGYVMRLTGLGNELDNLELDRDHPINKGSFVNINPEEIFTSYYTFKNPNLFMLPVKTKIKYIKDEEILIFNDLKSTKLYKEYSLDNLISWSFENYFWINNEGEVVKSIQSFTPKNPKIFLKLTKKYKKPGN